jgi:hypothetical protein
VSVPIARHNCAQDGPKGLESALSGCVGGLQGTNKHLHGWSSLALGTIFKQYKEFATLTRPLRRGANVLEGIRFPAVCQSDTPTPVAPSRGRGATQAWLATQTGYTVNSQAPHPLPGCGATVLWVICVTIVLALRRRVRLYSRRVSFPNGNGSAPANVSSS